MDKKIDEAINRAVPTLHRSRNTQPAAITQSPRVAAAADTSTAACWVAQ